MCVQRRRCNAPARNRETADRIPATPHLAAFPAHDLEADASAGDDGDIPELEQIPIELHYATYFVMPGLVPGIHVDGRDKPGHDEESRFNITETCSLD